MEPAFSHARLAVVGVGADGWDGLGSPARAAVAEAEVLFGSSRQLALIPDGTGGERVAWPSPLLPALPALLRRHADRRVCVLASGDPMYHGIGATLARLVDPRTMRVFPQPSAVSLACARMGWPVAEAAVVSAVGRPLSAVHRALSPGARIVVLSEDAATPAALAALLREAGYGPSELTVLAELGGPGETRTEGTAAAWPHPPGGALNVVAVTCRAEPGAAAWPVTPGLPDTAYATDGQLTKRDIRAVTLARLAPAPGATLWDVGAGSGSVAIEWLRSHPTCRAVAVESDARRAGRIADNAARLGVPHLRIVTGRAPEALEGLPAPDAVFVGGGAGDPAVLAACRQALGPGGRLVVNAVTVEAAALLTRWQAEHGGELTRLSVERAEPLPGRDGSARFAVWRPALPVTQWTVVEP